METIIIMDAAAKRADLEKKALEKKILEELEKKQMENAIQKRFESVAKARKKRRQAMGSCRKACKRRNS